MLTGSIVALITPMDERGAVDKNSLKKLVDYHIQSSTTAIVSVGTTGESATLNHQEHIDVIKWTLDYADGRIPIIAGTGANATSEAVALTEKLTDTGVAACLTVTPYYNKPTQEGLYQHFKQIAENTELPQILYNVPGRTCCDLQTETIVRLAKIPNIIGLKDATGNLSRVSTTRHLVGDQFLLFSGDDATFFDFMLLGGNGVISVTANVAAKQMAAIYQLIADNRLNEAREINNKLLPLHQNLFVESNPIPVKWVSEQIGLIENSTLRLPLTPLSDEAKPKVRQALQLAELI